MKTLYLQGFSALFQLLSSPKRLIPKTYFSTLVYALYGVFPDMTEPQLLFPSGLQGIVGILHALQNFVLTNASPSAKQKVQDVLKKLNTSDRGL